MKIHIITIGQPKLAYARMGWREYITRLQHYHTVRVTHIADKHDDSGHILQAAGSAYKAGLIIGGTQLDSHQLSSWIETCNQSGREVALLIGGPNGLQPDVIAACDMRWSLSKLTFPHDLAMVILVETLYRASTIAAGQPYHR